MRFLLVVWFFVGILRVPFVESDQSKWRIGHSYPLPLPQDIMVDAVNYIGLVLLQAHNQNNENNIAISPYGATSVLVALGEGVQGTALDEILRATLLPLDVSISRVGLRDIHRHLKSYFIPQEGFLAGLTFSHDNVTLKPSYEKVLRFYGYDVDSFNNALYPDPSTTTSSTTSSKVTATTPSVTLDNREDFGTTEGMIETTAVPTTNSAIPSTASVVSSTTTPTPTVITAETTQNSTGSTSGPVTTETADPTVTTTATSSTIIPTTIVPTAIIITTQRSTPVTTTTSSSSQTANSPMTTTTTRSSSVTANPTPVIANVSPSTIGSSSTATTSTASTSTVQRETEDSQSITTTVTNENGNTDEESTTPNTITMEIVATTTPEMPTTTVSATTIPSTTAILSTTTIPSTITITTTTTIPSTTTETTEATATTLLSTPTSSPITVNIVPSTVGTGSTESTVTTTENPLPTIIVPAGDLPTGLSVNFRPTTLSSQNANLQVTETTEPPTTIPKRKTKRGSMPRFKDDAELVHSLKSDNKSAAMHEARPKGVVANTPKNSLPKKRISSSSSSESLKVTVQSLLDNITSVIRKRPRPVEDKDTDDLEDLSEFDQSVGSIRRLQRRAMDESNRKSKRRDASNRNTPTSKSRNSYEGAENLESINSESASRSNQMEKDESRNVFKKSTENGNLDSESSEAYSTYIMDEYVTESTEVQKEAAKNENSANLTTPWPRRRVLDLETLNSANSELFGKSMEDEITSYDNMKELTESSESKFSTDKLKDGTLLEKEKKSRLTRSVIDYLIARYHDKNPSPYYSPSDYEPVQPTTFAVNGQLRETNISFMTYDTVLPYRYFPHLNAMALSFPLDSTKYYLLLLLPIDEMGIDNLISNMRSTTLKQIVFSLHPTRVKATIPSFMLKGYVVLTPTLQKLGIRQIFEPRHADFSRMTDNRDIYVTNIEQAVTVTIRNYVDPSTLQSNNDHYLRRRGPVQFKADHPFLYFVMDSQIHVALMAGKIINPLNSRIR